MRRKQTTHSPVTPYVVYVTYPGGTKEYAYACDLPGIHRGSTLMINHAQCLVQSIEHRAPGGLRWVPGSRAVQTADRRTAINRRLYEIEKEELELLRWAKLKSPEAKKLIQELRDLSR